MNQQPELESDAIRSDIDTTRERMDETINQIGNRLDGRHLVDEVLGFFRRSEGGPSRIGSQISDSASTAVRSVTHAVKENPIPSLLIGAGVAWLIYNSRSSRRHDDQYESYLDYSPSASGYAGYTGYAEESTALGAEEYTDQPLDQPSASMASQAKDKLSQIGGQARDKMSAAGERGKQTLSAARERASQLGQQAQQRGRELYGRTREQVVSTAQAHPLEVGLGCLAIGLIAGLALPTPERLNRTVGPRVDRLRQQTREKGTELIEKGKRVVQAAADAVKNEAESQGLTPEKLRSELGVMASRASEAAATTAKQEGLTTSMNQGGQSGGQDPQNRPGV